MYQYFIKVVPTKYEYLNKTVIDTNQFSSTEHFRKIEGLQRGLPGVFFFYDLSPIMVTFAERSSSFLELVTVSSSAKSWMHATFITAPAQSYPSGWQTSKARTYPPLPHPDRWCMVILPRGRALSVLTPAGGLDARLWPMPAVRARMDDHAREPGIHPSGCLACVIILVWRVLRLPTTHMPMLVWSEHGGGGGP